MALKTDYKDDVFSGQRKYTMTDNGDNTVSFTDVTTYSQIGDSFGTSDINEINQTINDLMSYLELTQTLSTTNLTEFVFTNPLIKTNSVIDVYAKRSTGDVVDEQNGFFYDSIYTANGQAIIAFPPFTSEILLNVRIYIR